MENSPQNIPGYRPITDIFTVYRPIFQLNDKTLGGPYDGDEDSRADGSRNFCNGCIWAEQQRRKLFVLKKEVAVCTCDQLAPIHSM